jgi:ubiquinone/menaquinone biosynthesis C-methylase UbiE
MVTDKIALVDEQRGRERYTKCVLQKALSQLGYIDGKVLDCGCGYGFWTKRLEPYCEFIVGIDIRDIFVRDGVSSRLDFALASGCQLPFSDESFKCAVLLDVLEHIENALDMVREIHRVLEKGGCLMLTVPNKDRLAHRIKKVMGRPTRYPLRLAVDHFTPEDTKQQWHFREYSRQDLIESLKKGFDVQFIEGVWLGFGGKGIGAFPSILEGFAQIWLAKAVRR